ncbi:MAG TPA: DMT family transporter [Thermoplasmata archaeon]
MSRPTYLYLLLALTILIWGNSFVIVQVAIDDGSPPILIAMGRFIVASSVFGVYLLLRRPKWFDRSDLTTYLFLAFIGIGIYYVFQYYGVSYAGPAVTAILVTLLCPVMIFLISRFKYGEKVAPQQTLGLAVAAVGSFFVITDGDLSFMSNMTQILGGVFGVVCAILWAVFTVEGKKIVRKYDPFVSTAHLTFLGTAMLVPIAISEYLLSDSAEFHVSFVFAILYLGVLCTVLGYVFWFKALTGLSASSTGATLYFEPVVTVIFAYILLGQGIGWTAAAGGALVLVGILLIARA